MTPVQTREDIARLIADDAWMMKTLHQVQLLNLPDWYIGAGFVRNKVWDVLSGYAERTPLGDIDVIYFDPTDLSTETEQKIETSLSGMDASKPWSVKNQARMHIRNGDAPYANSIDAFSRWPETATCIGVRLADGNVVIEAPHGIEDLIHLRVRPSPHFLHKMDIYQERIRAKKWEEKWPALTHIQT